MKVIGVIPVRYASMRFPGKPLALIHGKPLLQWVFEASQKSKKLDEVIVATDDKRIVQLCQHIKAPYVMTDPDLPSGSDRVWTAICEKEASIVLNIQGDEPLIPPHSLDLLVEALASKKMDMTTLGGEISENEIKSFDTVKVVCNQKNEAIYFSRFPIPYSKKELSKNPFCLRHIGVYCYQREFLKKFFLQAPVEMEKAESLEQLRALYLGARIGVVFVDCVNGSVDTPEDVKKLESLIT